MDFDGAAAEWVRRNYNSDVIVGSVEFDVDFMAYVSGPCYSDIDVTWRENRTVKGPSYRLPGGGSFRAEKRVVRKRTETICGRGDTDGRKDYDITMLIREIVAIATEHNDAV